MKNILRTFLSLTEIDSHMLWERLTHEIYYSSIPNNYMPKLDHNQVQLNSVSWKKIWLSVISSFIIHALANICREKYCQSSSACECLKHACKALVVVKWRLHSSQHHKSSVIC